MTTRRIQGLCVFVTVLACVAVLYAQNPVSIQQLGSGTTVTTTLPISAASLPLPTGASTEATLSSLNGKVTAVNTGAVTISAALPAGNNNIGDVDVATVPADPFGVNADAASATGSISAKLRQIAANGIPVTSLPSNASVNVAQINGVTPLMGNGATGTGSHRTTISDNNSAIANWGLGATGAAVPSGAQYRGGRAATALPTADSSGNLVGAMFDKYGRQVMVPGTIRDLVGTQTTTLSATTSETTIVSAAASVFNDLVALIVTNTSASTSTRIDIRDTTGGSVLFSLISIGGQQPTGFTLGGVAVPQTTVNTNWTAQCATSTTDVRIYAVFQKNR